jgi:ABC-type microcin C transport system duplicated ATPase subunit YejF
MNRTDNTLDERAPLLIVNKLTVSFGPIHVVDEISFFIDPGETFALVGESGSGKSITALSVLRLMPSSAEISAQSMRLSGEELLSKTELDFCKVRSRRIAMIFQEPMSSLNPVMTVGAQIAETIVNNNVSPIHDVTKRVIELLRQVEIPDPDVRINDYPHQLSGGQRQRVMIAIALAGQPDLLIADEPTTSLDVTVQAQIIALLKRIQQQTGMTLWFISHDLALVSNIADRVAIMQHGKIVETGKADDIFTRPQHTYTQKLIRALPSLQSALNHKVNASKNLIEVQGFSCYYPIKKGLFKRIVGYVKAVDDVTFSIPQGKTLALVGESGCGKTTLGKSLLALIPKTSGTVKINGIDLGGLSKESLRQQRTNLQIIFQDPFSSMNPRMLVRDIVAEGANALNQKLDHTELNRQVAELLTQVGLPADSALRYPHEFSGGQRQRICIARALAVNPKLIVCDEPTSALDVSVQAQIIQLLKQLQKEQGMSYLFITHDLAVVAEIADLVAVMHKGRIIEYGEVSQVLFQPQEAYTQTLIAALPLFKGDKNH